MIPKISIIECLIEFIHTLSTCLCYIICLCFPFNTDCYILLVCTYRDRKRQRGKDDGLNYYLGIWQHSPFPNFSTIECAICGIRFFRGSKISVESHQMYIYHMSKKPQFTEKHCFAQDLMIFTEYTPRTLCHLRVDVPKNVCVQMFKL